jgi:hypothetical protein
MTRFEEYWVSALNSVHGSVFLKQCDRLREIAEDAVCQIHVSLPEIRDAIEMFKMQKKAMRGEVFDRIVSEWTEKKYFDYNAFYRGVNYVEYY